MFSSCVRRLAATTAAWSPSRLTTWSRSTWTASCSWTTRLCPSFIQCWVTLSSPRSSPGRRRSWRRQSGRSSGMTQTKFGTTLTWFTRWDKSFATLTIVAAINCMYTYATCRAHAATSTHRTCFPFGPSATTPLSASPWRRRPWPTWREQVPSTARYVLPWEGSRRKYRVHVISRKSPTSGNKVRTVWDRCSVQRGRWIKCNPDVRQSLPGE